MKKLLSFLFATLVIIACSDSNPTDAFGNKDSSSNQDKSQWTTYTRTRYYSFLDTIHLRYYHIDYDCLYNESTNSFSWVTNKYQGIVNIDTMTELSSPSGHGTFGYKLSNDTLYECDNINAKCDDMSQVSEAEVYTGSSKSLLGTWNYVGRIYHGQYFENEEKGTIQMTITPLGTTEAIAYDAAQIPFYYSGRFCGIIYHLFSGDKGDLQDSCYGYFDYIKSHEEQVRHYNANTNTYEPVLDTVKFGHNFWVTSTGLNQVAMFIENMLLHVEYSHSFDNSRNYTENDLMVSYNGKECHEIQKKFGFITKEMCEDFSIENTPIHEAYSYVTKTTQKKYQKTIDTEDEFMECVKQFRENK